VAGAYAAKCQQPGHRGKGRDGMCRQHLRAEGGQRQRGGGRGGRGEGEGEGKAGEGRARGRTGTSTSFERCSSVFSKA